MKFKVGDKVTSSNPRSDSKGIILEIDTFDRKSERVHLYKIHWQESNKEGWHSDIDFYKIGNDV